MNSIHQIVFGLLLLFLVGCSSGGSSGTSGSAEQSHTSAAALTLSLGQPTGSLDAGTTTTNVSLVTSHLASCRYALQPGVVYDSMQFPFNSNNGMTHETQLNGLLDGESYQLYVRCNSDVAVESGEDYPIAFSVNEFANDPLPTLVLSQGQPSQSLNPGTTSSALSLVTSHVASCRYALQPSIAYDNMPFSFFSSDGTFQESQIDDLVDGGNYQIYVRCESDEAINSSEDYLIAFSVEEVASSGGPISAGNDQTSVPGGLVLLEAQNADNATFIEWQQITGTNVVLTNSNQAISHFTAPQSGDLRFKLTCIIDGNEFEDEVSVAVAPVLIKAFPSAEGFGAKVTGGRNGRVVKVTTLAANGPGSLQAALDLQEPRIIVFDVSGVINADIEIPYGDVTIAGQTAPGAGITIHGRLIGRYQYGVDNIIIRHLRVRPEYDGIIPGEQFDGIQLSRNRKIILDHVSASFGVDETIDMYEAQDVTVQWSTIEMASITGHPEAEHNYGFINGPNGIRVSMHHNLFVHNKNRNPALANGPAEMINNVIYNARHGFVHHNPASGPFSIQGNYFQAGPSSILIPFWFDDEDGGSSSSLSYYLANNYIDDPSSDCSGLVQNPWQECSQDLFLSEAYRSTSPFSFIGQGDYYSATLIQDPETAYTDVLRSAGAFPRDIVTKTAIDQTSNGTGTWGATIPTDWMEGLVPGVAQVDSDNDGLPDIWELTRGFDIYEIDSSTLMASGYTAIEEYLTQRANDLLAD